MKKRVFAIFLTAALCIGLMPTSAFAEAEDATGEETTIEENGDSVVIEENDDGVTISESEEEKAEAETYSDVEESTNRGVQEKGNTQEDVPEGIPEEEDDNEIMTLAVTGDAGISSFSVSAQIDGTAPWDSDDNAGNDSNASNNIVRTFDYVNYTLAYTTELSDAGTSVDSGNVFVEFTLPCGPDVASFNMGTLNWVADPVLTYYLPGGNTTTEYTNGMDVDKQVLTGYRTLTNTSDHTAIPGTGTLSVGIYIGGAKNGTTLQPTFTAWMDENSDEDKVIAGNVQTLTISAAQKYNIAFRQSSEMNISGTYDISTGNENASKDTISGNTSLRGRMEGYGITVMLQNDADDKGLKGLEFPDGDTDTITFDLTLTELSENKSGNDLTDTSGYTPLIWDYDANLRKTAANGGDVGQWGRKWVYTNSANMDCAYQAAPFNKLGCHTYSTVYDSCYDGGDWHMEQDSTDPFVYHVTISNYTFDYENYNFPSTYNTWYARTEPGTTYTARQACFSSGTIQMILQFPEEAVDAPTHIYYQMVADNFKVGNTSYNVRAEYTNTYELVPEGSIQSGTNFTDDAATNRALASSQLGTSYTSGDAYSFIGKDIRLWGYVGTSTDRTVRTNATLIKFDANAFDINPNDSYTKNGHYAHGSGEGKVNSYTFYFVGRSKNWESDQVMSDTLINSTDLTYYSSLDALESAGLTCVGVLYIADVENVNNSSQSQAAIGLTIKDEDALIGNVYAACNDAWASYSTIEELEAEYGPFVTDGGTINAELATNGYDLYRAYCTADAYATMGKSSTADESYKKTTYDDNGNITGGHDVGYYGGTSLLICGEKSTVEISTDQSVYDLDSGERTATVTVQPTVVVEGNYSSEGNTTTTSVTVSVTLDKNIAYDEGTAYWGDQAIIPVITTNDDGSTVLTFTLENVTLGETLDALTFDCTIGHAGTAEDIVNNETVSLEATINSSNDHRAKLESYGNLSDTTFSVIRLSSTSLAKSVDSRMIELNGNFTWTLSYYNGASEDVVNTELVDVLPRNNDELGSSFNGNYSITKIELDFSEAQKSYNDDHETLDFYVSTNYTGTGKDLAIGEKPTTWEDLIHEETTLDDSETDIITFTVPEAYQNMNAFYCDLGTLDAEETVAIRLYVETSGNQPEDIYNNVFYEYATDQDTPVQSNLVTTQVVQRNISGRTWIDTNKNGLQDSGEPAFTNVTVTLYEGSDDEADPTGIRPYAETQAKDVYGNTVAPVKTDANGKYSFECLPAGTYRIEFSDVNGYIYQVTAANVGTNDQIDSDASEVSNENGKLVAAISDVKLPEIDDMDRYLYEDNYNDAGYSYITIDIEGSKEWDDADDQDGIRPASIEVYLLADGERISDGHNNALSAEISDANDWTFKFTDLAKYHEDGTEIVYSVEEVSVKDYDTTVSELTEVKDPDTGEGTGVYTLTITNKHEPEKINISGEKVWDDASDQDGKRPGSVMINLLADGEPALDENGDAITAIVTSDDDWKFSFTDLPKYKDGTEIQYNITEEAVDDYSTEITITQDEETGDYTVTVTNKYIPEKTSLNVIKVWDDEDDRDGFRPDSITVKLLANGDDTGKTLTLDESNNWQGSFTELDVNTPVGQKITYTIEEISVDKYDTVITQDETTGFVITNTHTVVPVNISGTKIWDDNNDRYGYRPAYITIRLFADGEEIYSTHITAEEDWTWSFTNLPRYKDGVEIEYTITEDPVDDYTTEMTGDAENGYTVTNKVVAPKLTKEVDEDDYQRKEDSGEEMHPGEDTEGDGWGTWDDADNNQEVTYHLKVSDLQGVANLTVHDYLEEGLDFESNTVEVTLVDDGDEKTLTEGEDADYTLTEGECSDPDCQMAGCTFEVKFNNDVFTDVSVDAYLIITYKALTETHVEDYDDYEDDILNYAYMTYGTNPLSLRRSAVISTETDLFGFGIYKYADEIGEEVALAGAEFVLEREDGVYATFEVETDEETGEAYCMISGWADNKDDAGTFITGEDGMIRIEGLDDDTYTLTETSAPVGYEIVDETITVVIDEDGNVTVDGDTGSKEAVIGHDVDIENALILTEVEGTKTWEDNDDQDGVRPESITIHLMADGEDTGKGKTVTAADDWKWSFDNLRKYNKDGSEIVYTFIEDAVDDYSTEYDGDDVINKHTPDQTSVSVTKAWDDDDDQDAVRPESVTVQLYADGEPVEGATVTLSEENQWTDSFTGLDIYRDQGERIVYTVEEVDVPEGYESKVTPIGDSDYAYTVTNTHTPETIEISGTKTWDDNDNKAGKRPEQITVVLMADDIIVDSTKVTEADGWKWSFTDLPKYADGVEIVYTIAENEVKDYTATYDGYNITNKYAPGETTGTPGGNGGHGGNGGGTKTGDTNNIGLWITLLIAAFVVAIVAALRLRKRS